MGRLPLAGQGTEAARTQELALHGRLHDQGSAAPAGRIRQDCALMRIGLHLAGRTTMQGTLRFASLAILAATLLPAATASAQVPLTSAEGGYSTSFPPAPPDPPQTNPHATTSPS